MVVDQGVKWSMVTNSDELIDRIRAIRSAKKRDGEDERGEEED